MLVVSNIDLKVNAPITSPLEFLKSSNKDYILNINNDYRYMKMSYYVSLHAETIGGKVIPTTENIIDAYRVPVLLVRASKAGVPTLPHLVTDAVKQIMSEFRFPAVTFTVNPFSPNNFKIAHNKSALYRAVKSLSMNYKYAVCAQPLIGHIATYKVFFGKCDSNDERVNEISKKVYETFKIPVCKLHMQHVDGKTHPCGLQHLTLEEISPSDISIISSHVSTILVRGEFN